MIKRRQWVMAERPEGMLSPSHFRLEETPMPEPGPGEILVRTLYLSVAPVMRQYMIDGAGIEARLEPGDVIHGRGVGQIMASRHPDYKVGEIVHGKTGWRDHAIIAPDSASLLYRFRHCDLSPALALGLLGMTGWSAWVGLHAIGKPKAGETVLVSGAAGGVGSIAGQLARIHGCRVVGIAGGPDKCSALVNELGFDEAVDYRAADFARKLADALPDGADVFFDNVGGPILDAALLHLNRFGRIVSCGRISEYVDGANYALANWGRIGAQRARMEGFFVYDHAHVFEKAEDEMAAAIRQGQLKFLVDIAEGFEAMPRALMRLFEGSNTGKQLVHVADL